MHVCALFCSRTFAGDTAFCGPRRPEPKLGGLCCHTHLKNLIWHRQTAGFSVTGTKFEDDDSLLVAAEDCPKCTGLQSYYRTRVPN